MSKKVGFLTLKFLENNSTAKKGCCTSWNWYNQVSMVFLSKFIKQPLEDQKSWQKVGGGPYTKKKDMLAIICEILMIARW